MTAMSPGLRSHSPKVGTRMATTSAVPSTSRNIGTARYWCPTTWSALCIGSGTTASNICLEAEATPAKAGVASFSRNAGSISEVVGSVTAKVANVGFVVLVLGGSQVAAYADDVKAGAALAEKCEACHG